METVFTNADFISLDEHNNTYSVMVMGDAIRDVLDPKEVL